MVKTKHALSGLKYWGALILFTILMFNIVYLEEKIYPPIKLEPYQTCVTCVYNNGSTIPCECKKIEDTKSNIPSWYFWTNFILWIINIIWLIKNFMLAVEEKYGL